MSCFNLSLKKLCLTGNMKTERGRDTCGYSTLQSITVGLPPLLTRLKREVRGM